MLRLDDDELEVILYRCMESTQIAGRYLLWHWALSRVERVSLGDGNSVIVKRSRSPLTDEGRILKHLANSAVPVPNPILTEVEGDTLTMVLEDLGPAKREPSLQEAAHAAMRAHAAVPPSSLLVLDESGLRELARAALDHLEQLTLAGRWSSATEIRSRLLHIATDLAPLLSNGAPTPPFGLCHSEFHPSSLHVGARKTALVDWARAFVGPGLLDIASFAGTIAPPDTVVCRALLDAYVVTGGTRDALSDRAGLPAERWALFWHRVWVVEWYLRSCATWMSDRQQDEVFREAVLRHLDEALACL